MNQLTLGEMLRHYCPGMVGTNAHNDMLYDPKIGQDAKIMAASEGRKDWFSYYLLIVTTDKRWSNGYDDSLEIDT